MLPQQERFHSPEDKQHSAAAILPTHLHPITTWIIKTLVHPWLHWTRPQLVLLMGEWVMLKPWFLSEIPLSPDKCTTADCGPVLRLAFICSIAKHSSWLQSSFWYVEDASPSAGWPTARPAAGVPTASSYAGKEHGRLTPCFWLWRHFTRVPIETYVVHVETL